MMKTVVALYDHLTDAQKAVQDLIDEGLERDHVSLVAGDREGRYSSELGRDRESDDRSAEGAATGAVIGGIGGALLSLGALAIPGIGPVVAAGPLIAGLVGAGVGAAVGGLVGALIDAGLPEEHAGYYAEGVRRGGALVSVETSDAQVPTVVEILDRHDPVDINERVSTWRQSGWTGFDPGEETLYDEPAASRYEEFTSEPAPSATRTTGSNFAATETGRTGESVTGNGGYRQRNWADSPAVAPPNRGQTDESWRNDPARPEVNMYDASYQSHFERHFANRGYSYTDYEPAYLYGNGLAYDSRFQDRDWSTIEPEARIYWTTNYPDSPWEEFKDAIRHGWEQVKQAVR